MATKTAAKNGKPPRITVAGVRVPERTTSAALESNRVSFEWIPINQLFVDEASYQRHRNPNKVKAIMRRGWDMRKCLALGVSDRGDGTYAVWEGGHRLEAAKNLGDIPMLPCMVSREASVADEAGLFVDVNHYRANMSHVDIFKALLVVGDEGAKEIKACVEGYGFKIAATGSDDNVIQNTRMLAAIWDRYGIKILDRTMFTLKSIWDGTSISLSGQFMHGFALFLSRANPSDIQLDYLIQKMQSRTAIETKRRYREYQISMGVDAATALANVLVKTFNDRLPKGYKRIPPSLFNRSESTRAGAKRKYTRRSTVVDSRTTSMFIGAANESKLGKKDHSASE